MKGRHDPWVKMDAIRARQQALLAALQKYGWHLLPSDGVFLIAERVSQGPSVIVRAKTEAQLLAKVHERNEF